jgi:hypothetical protein
MFVSLQWNSYTKEMQMMDTAPAKNFAASAKIEAVRKVFKPHSNDFRPHSNDFRPYSNDFRPYSNDFRPHSNDFRPYSNDFRPYSNDFKPHSNDFKPVRNDKILPVQCMNLNSKFYISAYYGKHSLNLPHNLPFFFNHLNN